MAEQGRRVQQKRRRRRRRRNTGAVALAVILVICGVAVLGTLGLGAYVANLDTIYPNVKVAGIDVGGMSYDAAHSTLLNSSVGIPSGVRATAVLTSQVSVSVTSDDAGLVASINEATDAAMAYGRGGNFLSNTVSFLRCLTGEHDVYAESEFNESGVRAIVDQAADRADHLASDCKYEITDTAINVTKGSKGYTVDREGVFRFIRDTLLSGVSNTTEEFSEANAAGEPGADPDFDAIYNEIYRDPVDSVYDAETNTASASQVGVSFDRDDAKTRYEGADPGALVVVPLIFTQPQVTEEQVTGLLFKDKLAEKSTSLSSSSKNRITNVTLAAAACNGIVLKPGDEFSFNGATGQRTVEKGYKEAGAYAGGTTVQEVGGGICQVSSTIYYCTLLADLQITKRTNHAFTVAYLPAGFDATVNWPNLDFKFKNDKSYPIQIKAWVENKTLYVELWGTKETDNYVVLESNVISRTPPETVEQVDETLKPGERVTKSSGHTGCKSEAYKLLYDKDGKLISRTLISKDTYKVENKVILVGPPEQPAPEEPPVTNPPEDTTSPGEGEEDPGETGGGDGEMGDPNESGTVEG